jgi:molecular chaperone GrpE
MRAEREVSNAHKFAVEKFAGGLLEVVDNLERALSAANPQDEANQNLIEGLAANHKVFLETLKSLVLKLLTQQVSRLVPSFIKRLPHNPPTKPTR